MDDQRDGSSGDLSTTLQLVLRVDIAGLLLGPGVSKFLTYQQSVQFFERLALPAPDLLGVETISGGRVGSKPTR